MASRSINKVILLGNLTRDPVVKLTTAGTSVATFSVATNRSWTTAEGQVKEDVQYHNIVAWQKLAELVGKILAKGRKVYLEGRLTSRKYTGKDGVERYTTEVVMEDFIVLDSKRPDEAGAPEPQSYTNEDRQSPPANTDLESINPDDIPF